MKLNPPLSWHGGKSRFSSKIIALFPEHHTYCEVFGGSGAVLLAKGPSSVEVYNDIDAGLVNLFRVIHDPRLCRKLERACVNTLYSRAEFDLAREPSDDPVERARRFLIRHRMSRGGLGEQWSFTVKDSCQGMASVVRGWLAVIGRLSRLHERLRTVQIEQADWREILDRYDSPETLFYADPPYLFETRIGGRYPHEMTRSDHDELIQRILMVKGMVVLSGYQHASYKPLEACGWVRRSCKVIAHSSDKRSRRVEQLWLSPAVIGRSPNGHNRMQGGAYWTNLARVRATEEALRAAIERLRTNQERVTIAGVGAIVGMSREHLSRRYQHLFTA
jgi:DNA adenine methylase